MIPIVNEPPKTVVFSYEKIKLPEWIEFPAEFTAYDDSAEENGGYAGRTAMSTNLRPGVIAVPPEIPLGSEVMINDKIHQAEDIGGAIQVTDMIHIDIFMESRDACNEFGRRRGFIKLRRKLLGTLPRKIRLKLLGDRVI